MFLTVVSLLVMALAAVVGFFAGIALGSGFGGAILFALIAGIACIVHVLDRKGREA